MATILLVEDEVHILRVMSLWLTRHGHRVVEACDGADAMEKITQTKVDIIVSDMNMPKMTGLELIQWVREDHNLSVPFILVTARCDQTSLRKSVEPYGVQLYSKPFIPSQLVRDIEQALASVVPKETCPNG